MQTWITKNLPIEQLKRLDFLVGEFSSWHTMWPVGRSPVQFRSVVRAHREGCDRFLRMEQFSDVPGIGLVSSTEMFTFNRRESNFEAFGFSTAHEESLMKFHGGWEGDRLILTSTPARGYAGFERYRHTFTPTEAGFDFLEERWDICGFVRHMQGSYLPCPI